MGSRWQDHHDAEELRLYRQEVPWPTRFMRAAPAYLIVGALFVLMVVIGLYASR